MMLKHYFAIKSKTLLSIKLSKQKDKNGWISITNIVIVIIWRAALHY